MMGISILSQLASKQYILYFVVLLKNITKGIEKLEFKMDFN